MPVDELLLLFVLDLRGASGWPPSGEETAFEEGGSILVLAGRRSGVHHCTAIAAFQISCMQLFVCTVADLEVFQYR